MKHLYVLPTLIVLSALFNPIFAQPDSGYLLETLDQPYIPLTGGVTLGSENWDDNEGWDDPQFLVPIGFDFDFIVQLIHWTHNDGFLLHAEMCDACTPGLESALFQNQQRRHIAPTGCRC